MEEDYPLHAHTRDFLDKLKVRNRKTNASMEIGYNSALPALLALEAMKDNKVLGWDPVARKSTVHLRLERPADDRHDDPRTVANTPGRPQSCVAVSPACAPRTPARFARSPRR